MLGRTARALPYVASEANFTDICCCWTSEHMLHLRSATISEGLVSFQGTPWSARTPNHDRNSHPWSRGWNARFRRVPG